MTDIGPAILPEPFDPAADRARTVEALRRSPEVEALTGTLDVYDLNTIVTFGRDAAEAVSKAADGVLKSLSDRRADDSGAMMEALARLMARFNEGELKPEKGPLGRLFGGRSLDRIIDKYTSLGADLDRIYAQLKQYEQDIRQGDEALEALFQANVTAFHELEKYIVAGEQGCEEIRAYRAQREADRARTGDTAIGFELETLDTALNMLTARVQDLKLSEAVALQTIPMIRLTQRGNMTLARKIDASLIVTLPVFKQALAEAILLKRQKTQLDAVKALDRSTQAMLRRNAQSGAAQAAHTALSAVAASLEGGGLSGARQSVSRGLEETRALQAQAQAQRDRDRENLEAIRAAYQRQHEAVR